MWNALGIAFRNLFQAKRRTLLLGFAVALVAMLFLVLRSVSQSVSERMIESATTLSSGHVNIGGFFKSRKSGGDAILTDRNKLRGIVREVVPEATAVIDRNRGWGRFVSPASSLNAGVQGLVLADETRFFSSLRLAQEREYKTDGKPTVKGDFKRLERPNTALIFASQAKKLEVDVGDTITLVTEGAGRFSNTVDLEVAAIASDMGFTSNFNIFVPRQTLIDLYRLSEDTTGAVMIYLPSIDSAQKVMERLRSALTERGYTVMEHDPNPFFAKFEKVAGEDWLGQRLDLSVWSDEISFIVWITRALDLVSFFVVGILALIVVGGITNAMWMSVRERTKEIGTMRAIGAQKGFIMSVFVLEALFLGFFAALAGIVVAGSGILILNAFDVPITADGVRLFLMANTLHINLHVSQLASTLGLFSVVTAAAALYPAWKASRLRPVEALMQSK